MNKTNMVLGALFVSFMNTNIVYANYDAHMLIKHVERSIENAEKGISKLNSDILGLRGLSSSKVRHFLNNICSLEGASYLEIGVWRGSTFISALYGNAKKLSHAVAIDNWAKDGWSNPDAVNAKDDFLKKTSHYLSNNIFTVYAQDSFTVDVKKIATHPVNIYFYEIGRA